MWYFPFCEWRRRKRKRTELKIYLGTLVLTRALYSLQCVCAPFKWHTYNWNFFVDCCRRLLRHRRRRSCLLMLISLRLFCCLWNCNGPKSCPHFSIVVFFTVSLTLCVLHSACSGDDVILTTMNCLWIYKTFK